MSSVDGPSKEPLGLDLVRVGKYDFKSRRQPTTKGYINILIHVKDPLSPYVLTDEEGVVHENYWQFSKCYDAVIQQKQTVHRYTTEPGWTWPTQTHYDSKTGEPTTDYWAWRDAGMKFRFPVRYPNGFHGRRRCLFVLGPSASPTLVDATSDKDSKEEKSTPDTTPMPHSITTTTLGSGSTRPDTLASSEATTSTSTSTSTMTSRGLKKMGLVEGRIRVYYKKYVQLCRQHPFFHGLKERLKKGTRLQINEVDGPPMDSKVSPFGWTVDGSIHVNKEVAQQWVRQSEYSFGHGICLAIALLDGDDWLEEVLSSPSASSSDSSSSSSSSSHSSSASCSSS